MRMIAIDDFRLIHVDDLERWFNQGLDWVFRRNGKKPSPTYDFWADFWTKQVLGFLISFPYELLAKYVARGVWHINGVASASVVGLLGGLTLPSPYKEFVYGAGFTSCSTNEAFTVEWEAFICFVFIFVNNAFRPILNGLGGKLGMTVYVAGHISALFLVAFRGGTFQTTCLDPTERFTTWVDFWFRNPDWGYGKVWASILVDIGFVLSCAIAGCITLYIHVHFDKNSNPVVASSLVCLAAGFYLPKTTGPLNFFIWTGSFVGMSAPAAKPGAYALVHLEGKDQVYSDMVSLFITGIWAGINQIVLWWMAPGIGGKFGFIAHMACLPMDLITGALQRRKAAKEAKKSKVDEVTADDNTDDSGFEEMKKATGKGSSGELELAAKDKAVSPAHFSEPDGEFGNYGGEEPDPENPGDDYAAGVFMSSESMDFNHSDSPGNSSGSKETCREPSVEPSGAVELDRMV